MKQVVKKNVGRHCNTATQPKRTRKKNKKKAELEYLFGYNCISLLSPANPTSSQKLKIRCSESLQQQHTMCAILLATVPNTLNIFHPFEVL